MTRYPTTTAKTYYQRYPQRPMVHRKRWDIASLVLGAVVLVTSWLLLGAAFGVAAIVAGIVARGPAAAAAEKPATAAVGIALGVVSILIAVGVVLAMLVLFNSDPCYPVKQHAGCY